jgi:hypothetical protein
MLERGRVQYLHVVALIPGAFGVDLAHVAFAGRVVEVLVHERLGRGDLADGEGRLAEAVQGGGERPHVGDFAGH